MIPGDLSPSVRGAFTSAWLQRSLDMIAEDTAVSSAHVRAQLQLQWSLDMIAEDMCPIRSTPTPLARFNGASTRSPRIYAGRVYATRFSSCFNGAST